jgi:hypothetical protein
MLINEEEVLAQLGVHDPEPPEADQAVTNTEVRTA